MARIFCKWILDLLGWKIVGVSHLHNTAKAILVVAPHTSNWDFILAIFIRNAYEFDSRFLAKSSLFKPPLNYLFKWLGGYPVNRKSKSDIVQQCIDIFNNHDRFLLSIAPEGTRGGTGKFKSGFYHIAKGANVDIILTTFDFEHRIVTFDPCFPLKGNVIDDIHDIEAYFEGVKGKNSPI